MKWRIFRPLFVFYVLVLYIFASFTWWATLHVKNNRQSFEDKVQIMSLEFEKRELSPSLVKETTAYLDLQKKLKRQNWMIAGEGIIFLVLLTIGTWKIHTSFYKEIQLNRQQRNFLLSITHELKSPIAGIKLATQTMLKRALPDDKKQQLLSNSLRDSNRLQTLVNNLLMAAKLETETIVFSQENQHLSYLLERISETILTNNKNDRQFFIDIAEDLWISGDRTSLDSIFTNLLENAVKYSNKGDLIEVKAEALNGKVVISIKDTGIGIPEREQKKVFRKFYRIGNEDTRTTKGTGLGLFIVKELVQYHNGLILLKQNKPSGSIFEVSFPKINVPKATELMY